MSPVEFIILTVYLFALYACSPWGLRLGLWCMEFQQKIEEERLTLQQNKDLNRKS